MYLLVFKVICDRNLMSFGIQLQSCPTVDVSANFRRVSKIAKSDRYLRHVCLSACPSVRPSVRMEHLGCHWTDFHEI